MPPLARVFTRYFLSPLARSRQRLKEFKRLNVPLTCGAFNHDGNIFAYAASYDWSKGSEHYSVKTNTIYLHAVQEKEVKPNPAAQQTRRR